MSTRFVSKIATDIAYMLKSAMFTAQEGHDLKRVIDERTREGPVAPDEVGANTSSDEVKMLILRAKESQNRLNRLLYVVEEKMRVDVERRSGEISGAVMGRSTSHESNLKANVQPLNIPKHNAFCVNAGSCGCTVDPKIAAVFEAIERLRADAIKNGAKEATIFFFNKIRKILNVTS